LYIEGDTKLDFQDVLIKPKRSTLESRSQVDLVRSFKPKYGKPFSGVPIIASNMATGTFEMLKAFIPNKMFVAIAKHFTWDLSPEFPFKDFLNYGFYTIGMSDAELGKLLEFKEKIYIMKGDIDNIKICVDIANGYTQKFSAFIHKVRSLFPFNVIIAGDVCTPEMTQELIIAGADFIKIGIGSGSECTTRLKTGVGYPQISAAVECGDAAHGLGAGIVLDGGMSCPGDVAKAFCANSDMVMIGGMFAGTDECDGQIITRVFETNEYADLAHSYMSCNGTLMHSAMPPQISFKTEEKKFKKFYGMSSTYAQEQHFGGQKEYRTSEGREEEVPYVGPVQIVINDILGGLRSCGTYIGANSLKNFGRCCTFIKVNRQHSRF